MAPLLSKDRLLKNACPVLTSLISIYKRTSEPFYVTSCAFQTVDAVCRVDPEVIESVAEQLLTALFTQVTKLNFNQYSGFAI